MHGRVLIELSITASAELAEPGWRRLNVRVSGVPKRRVQEFDALTTASETEVARFTQVQGSPVLILVDKSSPAASTGRLVFAGDANVEFVNSHPVIKAAFSIDQPGPTPAIAAPDLWQPAGDPGILGLYISSAPWAQREASLWVGPGDWRIFLIEMEPSTISVEVERS